MQCFLALNTVGSIHVIHNLIEQMIIKVNIKSVSITPDDITDTLQAKPSRCIGNLTLRRVNEVMKELTNWNSHLHCSFLV